MSRPRFLLFGDSITEQGFRNGGWAAALAETYSRKADVLVRGYGGYNTRWALFLLDELFPPNSSMQITAATIFFGANDAALSGRTSERQYVPIEEFRSNLEKIVHQMKVSFPGVLIVLITPPPIDEDGRLEFARSQNKPIELPERTNENTGIYAKEVIYLAKELHLPYIDLWSKMQETEGWQKKFLRDGLHPTQEGNAVLHEEVVRVFSEANLRADEMPLDFPHHSKIDGNAPEKAFHIVI
ncbi:GDSL esterase/lipase At5g62930-like [Dioscorea cayenensis subsp. rotundata]|uniref:GDSL esterase/lipase At5g62930-like n=1 Tax=Dioscorea cayennensis subsp. rotundata TaxID=55577 RepID=A0AB40B9N4_DIOCR|nr:GDSL esterase/lipase At5g62930-like [Dioscorea cayenensis subsp. rotundata]